MRQLAVHEGGAVAKKTQWQDGEMLGYDSWGSMAYPSMAWYETMLGNRYLRLRSNRLGLR